MAGVLGLALVAALASKIKRDSLPAAGKLAAQTPLGMTARHSARAGWILRLMRSLDGDQGCYYICGYCFFEADSGYAFVGLGFQVACFYGDCDAFCLGFA